MASLDSGSTVCATAIRRLHGSSSAVVAAFVSARRFHGRMLMKSHCGFLCAFLLLISPVGSEAASLEEGRGEMLYQNHCVACHTTQVHWRDQRLVKDWASLRAQVRRWERNTGLTWSEEDIEAVGQYLNQLYYQFPDPPKDKAISMFNIQRRENEEQGAALFFQGISAGE